MSVTCCYTCGKAQTPGNSVGILFAGWLSFGTWAGRKRAARADMLTWIVLGFVGWTLGFLFVLVLMRIAGDQDRAARHEEKRLDPYSDVAITQFGTG